MRKVLILGLISLAALLLGGPLATGFWLSEAHEQWSASEQSAGLPTGWRLQGSELQRGWMSSGLSLRLIPPETLCTGTCPPITALGRVHHGVWSPSAWRAGQVLPLHRALAVMSIDLNPLLTAQPLTPALPAVQWLTAVTLRGGIQHRVSLPASEHRLANGGQVKQAGLRAVWNEAGDNLRLQMTDLHLLTADGTTLALEQFSLRQNKGLRVLAARYIGLQQASAISLDNLRLEVEGDYGAELTNARIDARLERLSQAERGIGPFVIRAQAERLAQAPLQAMRKQLGGIYGEYGRQLAPQLQSRALQALLQRELPVLIAAGPRIQLQELRLGEGDQSSLLTLDLSLAPQDGPEPSALAVIQGLQASGKIELPATVLQLGTVLWAARQPGGPAVAPTELIQQWQEQGLLVMKGDRYHGEFQLQDEQLTVNGQGLETWQQWLASLESP